MTADTTDKNIPLTNRKLKCEMCGNEALPLQTLCKAHLEVRIAEQSKGGDYVSNPIAGRPLN